LLVDYFTTDSFARELTGDQVSIFVPVTQSEEFALPVKKNFVLNGEVLHGGAQVQD
jgi:hypothetical protein